MKVLVNYTNHSSANWTDKQREGWDIIIDIPFPQIPANHSADDVAPLADTAKNILTEIDKEYLYCQKYLCLQGEYTFCYLFILKYWNLFSGRWKLAIPTTERIVVEKNGEKISKFEFQRWRFIE